MHLNRREFLAAGVTGLAVASSGLDDVAADGAAPTPPDFSSLRADFPRALTETYLNSAAQHPVGVHAERAMQRYMDFMTHGPGEGRADFWEAGYPEVKPMFARLVNAKPSEIAFVQSTTVGENLVVNGLDLSGNRNIVTNDLHFTSCLHNYRMRQQAGQDVRIVRHRDWRIDLADMERAVNRNTRLVAVSLVSSVNGHLEDIKALSDLAHAHGAYLFADIIQGVGAIPVDVRAMGIDFASTAMYKWLMGEHGSGFLYVREDLQEDVLKPTLLGGGVELNYAPYTDAPAPDQPDIILSVKEGASRYECGTPSVITYAAQHAALEYIDRLGVGNIQAHARTLTDRLQAELPAMGYPSITPPDSGTPIVTFLLKDPEEVKARFRRAAAEGRARIGITGPNSALTVGRFGNHMRVSVSVFNDQSDLDRLLDVLA